MDQESDKAIKYLKETKNAWYLFHCTHIDNIENILQHGLLPRTSLEKQKISSTMRDTIRKDNLTDFTSLSISHPNYKLIYSRKYSLRTDEIQDIILQINSGDLRRVEGSALFFPENAAKSNKFTKHNFSLYTGISAVNKMFSAEVTHKNQTISRQEANIPRYFTTDPQAEILISGTIPPTLIRKVFTSSTKQQTYLENLVESFPNFKAPIVTDYTKFSRPDHWKALDYKKGD